MKGFGIYVQNDLLEPKHYKAMGNSIWLYLWCLDKMTSINEKGIGLVLGGKPIKLQEVNEDLDLSDRTYSRYIKILQSGGYIEATRTPYGYIIRVTKAKKQFGKSIKRTVNVAGENRKCGAQNRKCGGNKEDNTIDSTVDIITEQSSDELKANQKEDMPWNKIGDNYEEGVVDYESGELTNPQEEEKKGERELNEKIRHNLRLVEEMRGLPFGKGRDMNFQVKIYRSLLSNGWSHQALIEHLIELINSDHWKAQRKVGQYPGMNTVEFSLRNKQPV